MHKLLELDQNILCGTYGGVSQLSHDFDPSKDLITGWISGLTLTWSESLLIGLEPALPEPEKDLLGAFPDVARGGGPAGWKGAPRPVRDVPCLAAPGPC